MALEVVKWFNSHSRALGKLRDVMKSKLGKVLCLILPVITRWTSHYLATSRLLELEKVFKQLLLDDQGDLCLCAGERREAREKAEEILGFLEKTDFWPNLRLYVGINSFSIFQLMCRN